MAAVLFRHKRWSRRYLCLLRAAQLPSWGFDFSLLVLQQYWCLRRQVTRATVGFNGGEPRTEKGGPVD